MKLLKQLTLGALGLAMSIAPSFARVEDGTTELLYHLEDSGITVDIDTEECTGKFHGAYRSEGLRRQMIFCTGDVVDAEDHDTVRHETAHAIQHCVNSVRGTSRNTPILSEEELAEGVNTHLSSHLVTYIKEYYPQDHWLIEFEANYMAKIFTAEDLIELFDNACNF